MSPHVTAHVTGDAMQIKGTQKMKHDVALTPLGVLAEEARRGLKMVAQGEDQTIAGWLVYGAALNKGRKMFPSNNQFHDWKVSSQLATTSRDDEAAAMWAAEWPDDFAATRKANPRVRTVRGLHAKFKEAAKPTPKVEREVPNLDEIRVMEKLKVVIDHPSTPEHQRAAAQRKLDG